MDKQRHADGCGNDAQGIERKLARRIGDKMSNTLTREKRLLDELGRDIGTSTQLADRTGIKVSTVRYYMSKFHKEGKVTVDHVYEVGNPCYVWRLVDA